MISPEALLRIRERTESLLRTLLAHELRVDGKPLHVVTKSEHPPLFAERTNVRGFYGPDVDLMCTPFLTQVGRWTGNRAVVLAVDDLASRIARQSAEHTASNVICIALHEAGHYLDKRNTPAQEPTEFDVDAELAETREWQCVDRTTNAARLDHLQGHSCRFTRAGLHLAHRARQLLEGKPVIVSSSMVVNSHEIEDLRPYREALAGELADVTTPISEILDRPLPESFKAAFSRDALAFLMSLPKPGEPASITS